MIIVGRVSNAPLQYESDAAPPDILWESRVALRFTRAFDSDLRARVQTWNELPQPHDLVTLGLLKTNPRFSSPS